MTHKDKEERAKYMRDYRARKKAQRDGSIIGTRWYSDKDRHLEDDGEGGKRIYGDTSFREFLVDTLGFETISMNSLIESIRDLGQDADGNYYHKNTEKRIPMNMVFYDHERLIIPDESRL